MARKSSPTISQEELYPSEEQDFAREEMDDARLLDLEVEQESPFLRAQKRVSVRRGSIPKKAATRLKWTVIAATVICVATLGAGALYKYGEHSWRFRLDSSDNIDIAGTHNVTHAQVMEVLGGDIGRNIFFIPLSQRKAQLEQIPWVESASIMRFAPNRLRVEIQERTPVGFARIGPRISLIDAGGTLMELPSGAKKKYSFPVILGMNASEPLSTRVIRMKTYNQLIHDLDADGAHYSQDLSEVDLSDLENLKIRVNDPAGDVLVELGSSDYLKRYKTYVSHVQEWRRQFQKLDSVNLRYDNQVIVNPESEGTARPPALAPAAAKAAASAGVKPAALITRADPHGKPLPKPAFELSEKKLDPKSAAAKKTTGKTRGKKPAAKQPKTTAQKPAPKAPAPKVVASAQTNLQKQPATKTSSPLPASTSATPKPSAAIQNQTANPNSN